MSELCSALNPVPRTERYFVYSCYYNINPGQITSLNLSFPLCEMEMMIISLLE